MRRAVPYFIIGLCIVGVFAAIVLPWPAIFRIF